LPLFYDSNGNVNYTYDAAGNMTSDGSHTYTYDAEGNITKVDSGTTALYNYDALNHRARTVVGSAATEFVFNQNGQRVSVWNATTGTVERDQYYWGTKPVAFTASGATHFQHQDWLGTERARTAYDGTVEGTYASLPFGDGYTASGTDQDPYHYAQLDYDSESNTSHAQFRQYSSTQGRWLRPDPYYGSYVFTNPQSFNRYAYTLNMPLSAVDPSGQDVTVCDNEGNCYGYTDDQFNQLVAGGYGDGLSVDSNGNIICGDGSVCGTITVSEVFSVSVSANPDPSNFDPNDPTYQLAVALGKTGAYHLTSTKFYACNGAIAGGVAATIAAPYAVGLTAGASVAAQKVVDTVNQWIDAKPGDFWYQYGPKDIANAFGHACLGTTGK